MTTKIPVDPKMVYQSKSLIGFTVAVVSFVISSLSQQPWLDPKIADPLGKAGTVCGLLLGLVGGIDRPEVFFRKGRMREALEAASKELTVPEAAQTAQQALGVVLAPAEERLNKVVELLVDTQERLGRVEDGLRPTPTPVIERETLELDASGVPDFSSSVTDTNDGVFNPMEVI
jgi:hypothetical protein